MSTVDPRTHLRVIFDSLPYRQWAAKNPIDAAKVAAEFAGVRRTTPGSAYAAGFVGLCRAHLPVQAPPASTDPMVFWRSCGFFEAWGNGTPGEMVAKAKSKGAVWIGVQDNPGNRALAAQWRSACNEHEVKLAVWRWSTTLKDSVDAITYWSPDGWIENVEHFDFEALIPAGVRAAHPNLPLAVITNFSGTGATPQGYYDPMAAKPWIVNRWGLMPECYMVNEQGAQPTLSPQQQVWTAVTHLDWPEATIFPCFALYRTKPEYKYLWDRVWPDRQPGIDFYKGEVLVYPHHSFYLLENL